METSSCAPAPVRARRHRAAKIEPETLLADVDAGEVRALIVPAGLELQVPLAHVIAAGRPLDLDDARAEVGEEPCAVRSGEHAREVEDDEAGEGSSLVTHRRSIARGSVVDGARRARLHSFPHAGASEAREFGAGRQVP